MVRGIAFGDAPHHEDERKLSLPDLFRQSTDPRILTSEVGTMDRRNESGDDKLGEVLTSS
jgi:hypothetical protein